MKKQGLPIPVYIVFALFLFFVFATVRWINPVMKEVAETGNTEICILHHWEAATCAAPKTCKKCGATRGEPLGHVWGSAEIETPATCEKYGVSVRKCLRCGEEEQSVINATGHDYQEWVIEKDPTCFELGVETSTCKTCGHKDSRPIDMVPHVPAAHWVDMGFSEADTAGVAELHCATCGILLQRHLYDAMYSGLTANGDEQSKIGGFDVVGTLHLSDENRFLPIMGSYSHEAMSISLCRWDGGNQERFSNTIVLRAGKYMADSFAANTSAEVYMASSAAKTFALSTVKENVKLEDLENETQSVNMLVLVETENTDVFDAFIYKNCEGK